VSIQISHGDLPRQENVDAIVNTVNCVGVMGKGIALQFKNKWPANFAARKSACDSGQVQIGKMFVFDCGGLMKPHYIVNFPTKQDWRGKSMKSHACRTFIFGAFASGGMTHRCKRQGT